VIVPLQRDLVVYTPCGNKGATVKVRLIVLFRLPKLHIYAETRREREFMQ
jgi:hypothetical protein